MRNCLVYIFIYSFKLTNVNSEHEFYRFEIVQYRTLRAIIFLISVQRYFHVKIQL